ncbi:chloramphenicol acetyltransferase (CAT-III) [Mariniradius saccharolyticus AK6]|uniref:Chloramphenicol acetyltransferase (CAT-III) n=1 Tax=Mariniradius saccharolyticus AK6 TaxID=1239962 RepID=M7X5D1_9BACT|nr:chloramphenicol acetyltransferase [Mariniradius saccharolyticus]EMS32670.1 chloramphenicol acetyltransferase (CAT-III) [Mariniradius saccharolyticus AK6]
MFEIIEIEKWSRKDHFLFFSQFEEPFFGVTVRVDMTNAYRKAKENGDSLFLLYLHAALTAANEVENFRMRINGAEVRLYDRVHASPTINRPDGTFGFSYLNYEEDFYEFAEKAKVEIEKVKMGTGLQPAISGENVIHFSAITWLDFSSVSHARSFSFPDSCPKISFGKITETNGIWTMPVSIHVHHALLDGYHVGLFVERFQHLVNT